MFSVPFDEGISPFLRISYGYVLIFEQDLAYPMLSGGLGIRFVSSESRRADIASQVGLRFHYENNLFYNQNRLSLLSG